MSGSRPRLLLTAGPADAGVYRGLLEAQGIDVIIQGEQHGALLPGIASPIELRLLVPQAQLERARQLLEDARPVLEGTQAEDVGLEGSVCAVHEAPAVAACVRCGVFLCAQCPSLGDQPLCEDCLQRPAEERTRPRWAARVAWVLALLLLGSLLYSTVVALVAGR